MTDLPPDPPPPRPPGEPPGRDPAWPAGPRQDGAEAGDSFRVPFSVFDGFLAVLWMLIAQLVVVVPAMLLGVIDPVEGGPSLLLVLITSQSVGLAGVLAWLSLRGRLSWRVLGPQRPLLRHVPIGVLVGAGGFVGVNLVLAALIAVLGPVEPPQQQLIQEVTVGGVTTVLAMIAVVVTGPVVEEVVFRGVLFQALKRRTGLWPAVVLSSLLFAAVHVEITQPLFSFALFLLGGVFALVYHRTGSLVVPTIGHAAFNLIAVVLAILGAETIDTV